MSEVIKFSGTISEKDYVSAYHLSQNPKSWRGKLLTLLLIAGGLYVLGHWVIECIRDSSKIIGVLLAIAVGAAVFYLMVSWYPKRLYRKNKRLQLPFEITIDQEGFRFQNEISNMFLNWRCFYYWRENRRVIILYQSNTAAIILPKSLLKLGSIDLLINCLSKNIVKH
jgi:hypothetical protein